MYSVSFPCGSIHVFETNCLVHIVVFGMIGAVIIGAFNLKVCLTFFQMRGYESKKVCNFADITILAPCMSCGGHMIEDHC